MDRPDAFVFLAQYAGEEDARADFATLGELHGSGVLGAFDAAVVVRDEQGHVHVDEHAPGARHGAWEGAAAGAVLGVLFPPSILVAGAVGAGAGALVGHFRKGLTRSDVRELSDLVGPGEAGIVVVASARMSPVLQQNLTRARTTIERGIEPQPELAGPPL
jgi:uncharacterized membrane protein